MKTQSADTHPEAEKVLIALLRATSPAKKFAMIRSLTRTAFLLSRRALERSNPDLSQRELDLLFVEHHYGKDLSERLGKYLNDRDRNG